MNDVLLGFTGFYWVLLGFTEFDRGMPCRFSIWLKDHQVFHNVNRVDWILTGFSFVFFRTLTEFDWTCWPWAFFFCWHSPARADSWAIVRHWIDGLPDFQRRRLHFAIGADQDMKVDPAATQWRNGRTRTSFRVGPKAKMKTKMGKPRTIVIFEDERVPGYFTEFGQSRRIHHWKAISRWKWRRDAASTRSQQKRAHHKQQQQQQQPSGRNRFGMRVPHWPSRLICI